MYMYNYVEWLETCLTSINGETASIHRTCTPCTERPHHAQTWDRQYVEVVHIVYVYTCEQNEQTQYTHVYTMHTKRMHSQASAYMMLKTNYIVMGHTADLYMCSSHRVRFPYNCSHDNYAKFICTIVNSA